MPNAMFLAKAGFDSLTFPSIPTCLGISTLPSDLKIIPSSAAVFSFATKDSTDAPLGTFLALTSL